MLPDQGNTGRIVQHSNANILHRLQTKNHRMRKCKQQNYFKTNNNKKTKTVRRRLEHVLQTAYKILPQVVM